MLNNMSPNDNDVAKTCLLSAVMWIITFITYRMGTKNHRMNISIAIIPRYCGYSVNGAKNVVLKIVIHSFLYNGISVLLL